MERKMYCLLSRPMKPRSSGSRPRAGTRGRTSSSSPISPRSTSCIAHTVVASLVIEATQVKEFVQNAGESNCGAMRPAEPKKTSPVVVS